MRHLKVRPELALSNARYPDVDTARADHFIMTSFQFGACYVQLLIFSFTPFDMGNILVKPSVVV